MHGHFRRYLLVNTGIILGSLLMFGVIFYLFSQALDSKVARILASRVAITQRSGDLESLNRLKADTAAAAELQKSIDALLSSQDGLIAFPQFMNALARTHSLTLTFNFDGAPVPGAFPTPGYVEFTAGLTGSAANIRSFVDDLEAKTTKFMVNLLQVTLTPRGDSYHGNLKGRVFFQENKIEPL